MKLSWQTPNFQQQVVETKYLFRNINNSLLKIIDFERDKLQQDFLRDFTLAFRNTKRFVIADVPQKFQNLFALKSSFEFSAKKVSFEMSSKAVTF